MEGIFITFRQIEQSCMTILKLARLRIESNFAILQPAQYYGNILMHDLVCSVSFQLDILHFATYDLDLFHLDGANLQIQTHFVLKMMHQNIAVILR